MKIWTAYCDYFATGEGRTLMACIVYANDETEAKDKFKAKFGDWYFLGCDAEEGVVKNSVTQFLFSDHALEMATKEEGRANIDIHASVHFNFS